MRLLLLSIILAILSFSVIAAMQNVVFIGSWQENTTLFSSAYFIENGSIWGKDVFPINETVGSVKICTDKNVTQKKKECVKLNVTQIHNLTRPRIKCTRLNDGNGTIFCQNVTYIQKIKTKQLCHINLINTTKPTCRFQLNGTPALCINPNGSNSNTLELRNFKMSLNNGSWQDIPYIEQKLRLNNTNVSFKVDIPAVCYPEYDINKAITLED